MRNNKGLTKKIVQGILLTGGIVIAATNPRFGYRILPRLIKYFAWEIKNKEDKKKFYNTFYRLKKQGLIVMEHKNKQLYISLTEEGKKKAGRYQIDDLRIEKPRKWDKKWRILIFDIKDRQKIKREALRGKIKQLGLYQLQKSVWVCPYDFFSEINLLREFFGLSKDEIKIITAVDVEDDGGMKKHFELE